VALFFKGLKPGGEGEKSLDYYTPDYKDITIQ